MVEVGNPNRNIRIKQPPHCQINCFPQDGLRYAIFSGPDGLADQRSHLLVDQRPIGTNPYSTEATYDTEYLWRFPQVAGTPLYLRPRSAFAGEIGWQSSIFKDPDPGLTGHQIQTSEFWRDLEDLSTHRYQSPWYPGQGEVADPNRGGAYFRRFPTTGQHASTWLAYRSQSCHPTIKSRSCNSSQGSRRPWRRAPAATPVSVYSGQTVNVGQREDEGVGSSQPGAYSSQHKVLQSTNRYSPAEERQRQDSSSSSAADERLGSSAVSETRVQYQF